MISKDQIFNLGSRCRSVVSLALRSFYSRGENVPEPTAFVMLGFGHVRVAIGEINDVLLTEYSYRFLYALHL
jgi:hypothetical protein